MGCRMMCPVSRARAFDLPWICLVLAAAAITVLGCANLQHRQKTDTVTVTDGKDTVTIRKTGDKTVIEAKELGTGERATITSRGDGTVTVKATAEGEEAVIEAGPGRKATVSVNGAPAVSVEE